MTNKHAGGRPTKYNDKLIEKAKAYISDYEKYGDVIPSIAGLASVIDVHRSLMYVWEKEYPEFLDILEAIKREQQKVLLNKGLSGDFNSQITKLVLGKHGYHDKQDVDLKGDMNISIGKEFDGV
jgi:hypothetical protein